MDVDKLAGEVEAQRDQLDNLRAMLDLANRAHGVESNELETAEWEPDELDGSLVAEFAPARPERSIVSVPLPDFAGTVDTSDATALVAQGMSIAAQAIPDFGNYADRIAERVQANPAVMQSAVATGDVSRVAATFGGLRDQLAQSDATRQMKLSAQTAVGASGRPVAVPSDQQEWAAIASAGPKGYWE